MSLNELRFRIQLTMEPFTISAALFSDAIDSWNTRDPSETR